MGDKQGSHGEIASVMREVRRRLSSAMVLPAFFGFKVLIGLVIIKLSAQALSVHDFTIFSQFFLFSGLLNTIAAAGSQNGLIRQIAVGVDDVERRTSLRAAQFIWLGVSAVAVVLALLRNEVAIVLVGDAGYGWVIPCLALISALSGLGLIYNAVLTGAGRVTANLGSQALGMAAGAGLSISALAMGHAALAVLGFAGGSLLTTGASWLLVRGMDLTKKGPVRDLFAEVRRLLGYAGAFVIVAILMPSALFMLRYFYRETFGVEALGYWLVANRLSDVSTQLLGLYMVQFYLPTFAAAQTPQARRKIIRQSFLLSTAVMTAFLVLFAGGAGYLVPFLLSKAFVPAIPHILIYMLGDVVRVSASIALYTALAQRKLKQYLLIEAGTVFVFLMVTSGLIYVRWTFAPMIGYVVAFAIIGGVCWMSGSRIASLRMQDDGRV